ncbi:hypothetical protein [Nocardia cyriacigeorgica]|uniref:hypothetical protein n=1 Tax=Nocardia cyriacigeorgica TaxID=135487 RepID=UPI0011081DF3|nr:hypothetical protein [Nocardia cyriacigeorgica]TLF59499.1 hypothetical protein FEK31_06990 [Nocardia cyriacigeorgica]
MTCTEARILAALQPGGVLTVTTIARSIGFSTVRCRIALLTLSRRGLVWQTPRGWVLTANGHRYAAIQRGSAALDVPIGAAAS